jgi:hypothetical protein
MKRHTTVHKTLYRKLKIDQREPQWKSGWIQLLRNGKQFLLNDTSSANNKYENRVLHHGQYT